MIYSMTAQALDPRELLEVLCRVIRSGVLSERDPAGEATGRCFGFHDSRFGSVFELFGFIRKVSAKGGEAGRKKG